MPEFSAASRLADGGVRVARAPAQLKRSREGSQGICSTGTKLREQLGQRLNWNETERVART